MRILPKHYFRMLRHARKAACHGDFDAALRWVMLCHRHVDLMERQHALLVRPPARKKRKKSTMSQSRA